MKTPGHFSTAINTSGTYLKSDQKLSPLQPTVALAGAIFNPPHFRGRAGAVVEGGALIASAYVNYTGSLKDVRNDPTVHIGSMTTVDLNARYAFQSDSRLFSGIDVALSVQNILDTHPSLIKTTQMYESPYDSTNFSAFGRVLSFTVSKKW